VPEQCLSGSNDSKAPRFEGAPMSKVSIFCATLFVKPAIMSRSRSRSRSRSHGKRRPTAYAKFVKANFGACYKDACKKHGEGKKAAQAAMKACAVKYRSKSR